MGYSDEFSQLLDRRNTANSAAYLFPFLEPGMRLLDLGCGPGTITVGLANAVSTGEVHGVDMEALQIALARAAAESGPHSNAIFTLVTPCCCPLKVASLTQSTAMP